MPEEPAGQQEIVVVPPGEAEAPAPEGPGESVLSPAKVMRIAAMARGLLEEVRQTPLDEASRARLADVYENSIGELAEVLSPDLQEELARLSLPFTQESPSEAELRVAHAQLVGWLEGLFHGVQAMLFAQQVETRQRLDQVRGRPLPSPGGAPEGEAPSGPGQYL